MQATGFEGIKPSLIAEISQNPRFSGIRTLSKAHNQHISSKPTLFERLYHGTKKYVGREGLLSLIRRARKSISERQTLIKNINQNIFSFLKNFLRGEIS